MAKKKGMIRKFKSKKTGTVLEIHLAEGKKFLSQDDLRRLKKELVDWVEIK